VGGRGAMRREGDIHQSSVPLIIPGSHSSVYFYKDIHTCFLFNVFGLPYKLRYSIYK